MPMVPGSGHKAISANIAELMRSWKEKGMMGNSKPRSAKDAQKMAAAIAYEHARRTSKKK